MDVVSGRVYTIYVVPEDTNDILGGVNYSYTAEPEFSYIDSNTVKIILSGNTNDYASFTFDNGQKIQLIIASQDTASLPEDKPCPNTAPVANAGSDQKIDVGSSTTLDGSGSFDADNDTLVYAWTMISRPSESSAEL